MFNRKLEMKVVKNTKDEAPQLRRTPHEISAAVQNVSRTVIKETGKVVIAYVVVDTIRKVILTGLTGKS